MKYSRIRSYIPAQNSVCATLTYHVDMYGSIFGTNIMWIVDITQFLYNKIKTFINWKLNEGIKSNFQVEALPFSHVNINVYTQNQVMTSLFLNVLSSGYSNMIVAISVENWKRTSATLPLLINVQLLMGPASLVISACLLPADWLRSLGSVTSSTWRRRSRSSSWSETNLSAP